MSKQIEQRVVQMLFDNAQFEKNASDTIETLEHLDKTLNSTASGNPLEKLQNAADRFSMSGVITAIEQTANKYSWLEQIAIGAYRKIGEKATQYLANQAFELTGMAPALDGWKKYESEIESVQAIISATGKTMKDVEPWLDKLSWYTSETSYEYEAMVQNIAKFNAAGVRDLKTSTNAMIGIANMAGYFGVNAKKATHAMEGFAKAMGKGYMDNASWQWIETAGMNAMSIQKAFLDTAAELKKIKKLGNDLYSVKHNGKDLEFKASEFKTVLKERWLDQKVMLETFKKYGLAVDDIYSAWLEGGQTEQVSEIIDRLGGSIDETSRKAFRLSQEAKTFTDVLESLKTVVADSWRTSFKYIFGNYEEARNMWTDVVNELWDIFAESGTKRNSLLKGWYEGGGRKAFLEGIANIWYGLLNIINPIKEAFDEIFPGTTVERLIEITERFRDLTEKFKNWFGIWDEEENPLTKTITSVHEVTKKINGPVAKTTKVLDKLANAVWRGDYGNGANKRRKALEKEGYSFEMVQNRVNELVEAYLKLPKGYYGRYKVIPDGTKKVLEEFNEEVALTAEEIAELKGPFVQSEKRAENLKNAFLGIFSAVSLVRDIFKGALKAAMNFVGSLLKKLSPTFDTLLEIIGDIGEKISNIQKAWSKNDTIQKGLNKVADVLSTVIADVINGIVPVIKKAYEWIKKGVGFLYRNTVPAIKKVYGWITSVADFFKKNIIPILVNVYNTASDIITKVFDKLKSGAGFSKLKDVLKNAWESVKNIASSVWDIVSTVGGELWKTIEKTIRTIVGATDEMTFGDVIALVFDKIADKIADFVTNVGKAKDKIVEFFQTFGGSDAKKVETMTASMETVTQNLSQTAENTLTPIKEALNGIYDFMADIVGKLKNPAKAISDALGKIVQNIAGMFNDLTFDKIGKTLKNTGIGVFFGILAKKLNDGTLSVVSIGDNFNRVLGALYETLLMYQQNLKASQLKTAAEAIGLLVLAVIGLSAADIDMQKIMDFAAAAFIILSAASMFISAINKFREITQKGKSNTYKIEGLDEFLKNSKINVNFAAAAGKFADKFGIFLDQIGNAFNKRLNGGRLAKAFLFVSAALAIIVHIIKVIKDEQWDLTIFDENGSPTYFGKIIGFLLGIGGVMAVLIRVAGGNQTLGSALSFVTAVIALRMVLDAIWEITETWSENRLQSMLKAAIFMGLVLTTIAIAIAATSKNIDQFTTKDKKNKITSSHTTKTGNSPFGVAMAILAYAIAFNLMVPAINAVGNLSQTGINNFLGFLVTFGLVVAGLAAVSNVTDKKGVKQVGSIAGMVIGAVIAIGAIAAIMNGITAGGSGWKSVIITMVILAGTIAVLAGAAALLDRFGVANAMVKLGDSLLKLGIGLAGVGVFAYLFGKAMKDIVDGLVYLGSALNDTALREDLMEGIAAIFLIVIGAIILHKSHLIQAIALLIEELSSTIVTYFPTMFNSVMDLLLRVVNAITNAKGSIILLVGIVLGLFLDVIDSLIPGFVDGLLYLLTRVANSLAASIARGGGELAAALGRIGAAIGSVIMEALSHVFDWIPEELREGSDWFNFGTWVDEGAENIASGAEAANERLRKAREGIQEETELLEQQINHANTGRRRKGADVQEPETPKQQTSAPPNALTSNIGGVVESFIGNGFDVNSYVAPLLNGKTDLTEAASVFMSGLPDGINPGLNLAEMNVSDTLSSIINNITGSQPEVTTASTETATAASDAAVESVEIEEPVKEEVVQTYDSVNAIVAGKRGEVEYATDLNVVQPVLSAMDGLPAEMERRGKFAVDGFVNGVTSRSATEKIWAAGSGVTKAFLGSYDITSGTESPAKTMIWRGLMAITGFAKGIFDNLSQVDYAGTSVAATLLGSVKTNLENSPEFNPTITPVLDMSQISSGGRLMNGLFGNPTLMTGISDVTSKLSSTLASDAFNGFNQNQILKQEQIQHINSTNADVVAALGLLRGDVNNLNESMGGLQVVMDSGQLVGAITQPIDNALGRRNIYKGRGI